MYGGDKMKKIIFFDTNMSNLDGSYHIDEIVIRRKKIKAKDKVIIYQDGEEWDAVVTYSENNWGVKIISEARRVSEDKRNAYTEGFWEGYYCKLANLRKVLGEFHLSQEDIDSIENRF